MKRREENRDLWMPVRSGREKGKERGNPMLVREIAVGRKRPGQNCTRNSQNGAETPLRIRCAVLFAAAALLLYGSYLTFVLAKKPALGGGFPEAGEALRKAILEDEAVAVFLGLDREEDPFAEESVLTMNTTETDFLPEKPNVAGEGWNFWNYIAGLLAPLLQTS